MDFQPILEYLSSYNIDVLLPILVVCFLLIVPWGPDVWQNIFTVTFLLKGITMLLFPQQLANFLILNTTDALHLQEMRCIGIILITDSLVHILTRKSGDPTVKMSLMWSRTLLLATSVMLMYFSLRNIGDKGKNNLDPKLLNLSVPVSVLFLGGYIYYSLMESDWGGYSEQVKTRRNLHIRIDFLIWFSHGMLALVYPAAACHFQTTLSDLDTAHGLFARCMGAGFLARSIVSGRCINFLREEDKKSVLLSHAIGNIFFLMTMAFCQLFTQVFSEWHLYYGMTFVALTAVNALIGCDVPNMVKSARIEIRKLLQRSKEE